VGEILTIRNFGPIKDMTLDLRHVNILIGDQGTGKSTVAKVLTAVKLMLSSVIRSNTAFGWNVELADEEKYKARLKQDFSDWIEQTGLSNSIYTDTYMCHSNEEYSFLYEEGQVTIGWKQRIDKLSTPVDTFIPAYREVAIVLKDKLFAVLQAKATLPDILTRFGTGFLEARIKKTVYDYRDIFGILYKHSNGMDYIVLLDGKEILIEDASSALRNGVPMLVVFDEVLNSNVRYCPYLIVEEPELNCFPETQEKLIRYFIERIKEEEGYKNRMLITTHSPYILTSLNNLMYAHVAGKSDPDATDKVIEKKYWLNPDDVSAYILKDGLCEDIFNRKEALIDAARIDEVSQVLNKQFDDLINIELSVTDEKDS
jgi:AAA ATPase domain